MVSHGSIHSIDADSVVPARAFGEADRIQIRMLVTASSAFGGLVGARWQEGAGPSVSHRELMRQLGRATADWRSGAGGRGVVVDPAGLRIEPFLFDLIEVVLPILREEPDRLAASIRDAGRRRIEPAVGRGLRAF